MVLAIASCAAKVGLRPCQAIFKVKTLERLTISVEKKGIRFAEISVDIPLSYSKTQMFWGFGEDSPIVKKPLEVSSQHMAIVYPDL